jgi:hypothetical protein
MIDQPDGGDDDRREHQAIDTIQKAAMARDDVPAVLDAEPALEDRS